LRRCCQKIENDDICDDYSAKRLKNRQIVIAYLRSSSFVEPYSTAGINFAVRHVRQNAFIANGVATTTTATIVTAIVVVIIVIIGAARTELLDRPPSLSREEPCAVCS
jgi:hypothetical protein